MEHFSGKNFGKEISFQTFSDKREWKSGGTGSKSQQINILMCYPWKCEVIWTPRPLKVRRSENSKQVTKVNSYNLLGAKLRWNLAMPMIPWRIFSWFFLRRPQKFESRHKQWLYAILVFNERKWKMTECFQ